jgi:probable F420-dependent oxidoreductase
MSGYHLASTDAGQQIGGRVKFGIGLALVHRSQWLAMTALCEELGFESVWFPDHLVFTEAMSGSPYTDDDHPPVPPTTPLYEPMAYLSFLAAHTNRVRLGTYVYLFGLRHPFVSARAFATLDEVSGGRAEAGVGSGWLPGEWEAVGWDFHTRGRRLDEAIDVAKRLWTDEVVEHHGEFFSFPPVVFEPKPVQRPYPPILVGGESTAALRRAVVRGDGWISMPHTFESAAPQLATLDRLCDQAGRNRSSLNVTMTDQGLVHPDEVARWEEAGVDRLIVKPYARTRDALQGVRHFRERFSSWF